MGFWELSIDWTVPYSIELNTIDLSEIKTSLLTYMEEYPDFTYNDLRKIVWEFIEGNFDDEIYAAFGEEQCDIVLNKVLEGFGIQVSMFDSLGRIIDWA